MKAIRGIIKGANFLVMIAILAIMMATVVDVVLRWAFRISIVGVTEYSQMLMVFVLLATGATALSDSHIKVDVVMMRCSPLVQNICEIIALLLSLVIGGLLSSSIIWEGIRAYNGMLKFNTLQIVKYPFYFAYALAMCVMCLSILVLLIVAIKKLFTPKKEVVEA